MSPSKKMRFGWRKFLLVAMLLSLLGCGLVDWFYRARGIFEVERMTESMKTVCVGRFLVDVPVTAEVSLSRERVAGFDIETVQESEEAFRKRIGAREAEIAARGSATDGTGGLVEARDLRIAGMTGRTLIYGLNRGYYMAGDRRVDDEYVSVESHRHIGGYSFSLSASYEDEAGAALAEGLLASLRLRTQDEIPAVAGFCIEAAVFAEPLPLPKVEHVAMHMGIPGHPDLALAFSSMPGDGADRGLLARVAENDAEASPYELLQVTKLRASNRSINGLPGEEMLERVRELNFTTGFNLMWEMNGIKNDPLRPYLLLQMETGTNPRAGGKPVDSTLHEDALVELWDRISSSIRLRPSSPPGPAAAPEPPSPLLGTTSRAGKACPYSGSSRCDETHALDGTRWFARGAVLPAATFQVPSNSFGLSAGPDVIQRRSTWQRVRRADAEAHGHS
nr:T6SS immunity protein Tli4 family protein [uncultured Massilia sp.]